MLSPENFSVRPLKDIDRAHDTTPEEYVKWVYEIKQNYSRPFLPSSHKDETLIDEETGITSYYNPQGLLICQEIPGHLTRNISYQKLQRVQGTEQTYFISSETLRPLTESSYEIDWKYHYHFTPVSMELQYAVATEYSLTGSGEREVDHLPEYVIDLRSIPKRQPFHFTPQKK